MKIGINCFFGGNSKVGTGRYTLELIKAISKIDKENQYFLYIPEFVSSDPLNSLGSNFTVVKHHLLTLGSKFLNKILWEQTLILKFKMSKIDIFHIPYFSYFFSKNTKNIVTIHDMTQYYFPVYKGSFFRQIYYKYLETAVKKADYLITDSKYSCKEIKKFTGIPDEKISVIPLAANESFKPIKDINKLETIEKKYNLPRKFIFYIGGFDTRKNVSNLIRAYASLKKTEKITNKLVLGGKIPKNNKSIKKGAVVDIVRLIQESEITRDVYLPGYIDEKDLPVVYTLANLFIFPSLYEGFGLPVLESMSCGTPIIASHCTSIPEIVNRDDLLFDPKSVESIKEKMMLILENETLKMDISCWGIRRSKNFSWNKTALETLKIYERVNKT